MPDIDCGDEYAPEVREPQGFRRTDEEIARDRATALAPEQRGEPAEAGGERAQEREPARHLAPVERAGAHDISSTGEESVPRKDKAAYAR